MKKISLNDMQLHKYLDKRSALVLTSEYESSKCMY